MNLEHSFKGLADTNRLRMINLLLHGELCGCDIQYVLALPQPNVSRHLSYLKHCGLVLDRRDGFRIFYRLADPRSERKRCLFEFLRQALRKEELFQQDIRRLKQAIAAGSCTRSAWRPFSALTARTETSSKN